MTSKEIAQVIENEVNCMGCGQKLRNTAENLTWMHRTLQQSFVSHFVIPFVRMCSENYESGSYDARNASSLEMMNVMFNALVEKYPCMKDANIELPCI